MNDKKSSITIKLKAGVIVCFVVAAVVMAACLQVGNNNGNSNGNTNSASSTPRARQNLEQVDLSKVDPFAPSTTATPTDYNGSVFQLNHNYPTTAPTPPSNPPWIQTLNGQPISSANAIAYTNALKQFITPSMKTLIFDYANWNPATTGGGWFSQPWLASIQEPIHGMYVGSSFPAQTFTEQNAGLTTYVLTYYDPTAAYTLNQVWGQTAMTPTVNATSTQVPEGGVIVKLAFVTASGNEWSAMQNAASWSIYAPKIDPNTGGSSGTAEMFNVYMMQCDIIVKDSQTSPKTGWVFTTLVFDNSQTGDAWDQMVPLGAMWGNDPNLTDVTDPSQLKETVINPNAPPYSTETLGWGGRLSGPNDGGVNLGYQNGTISKIASSSCMSCHGPAEWAMNSFLLPASPDVPVIDEAIVFYEPGSADWMKWFQDRAGNVPQDAGSVAFDYDMIFAFKSMPAWQKATSGNVGQYKTAHLFEKADAFRRGLKYNGVPY